MEHRVNATVGRQLQLVCRGTNFGADGEWSEELERQLGARAAGHRFLHIGLQFQQYLLPNLKAALSASSGCKLFVLLLRPSQLCLQVFLVQCPIPLSPSGNDACVAGHVAMLPSLASTPYRALNGVHPREV